MVAMQLIHMTLMSCSSDTANKGTELIKSQLIGSAPFTAYQSSKSTRILYEVEFSIQNSNRLRALLPTFEESILSLDKRLKSNKTQNCSKIFLIFNLKILKIQ